MKAVFIVILFLSIVSTLFSQEERKIIREGNEYYKENDFDNAVSKFQKAYEITPEQNGLLNNIAASQYRNGMFNESALSYENFLKMAGTKKDKADAFYNMGNSYLQAADYKNSIDSYRNALRLDPEHDKSRYNMAVATKIQEQQQQQQQQDQEQGDGDNNQDQQEKNDDNNDKNDQNQDKQNDQNQDKEQEQKSQPKDNEMSREEMERFLESLQQQEKEVQEKVKKEKFKTQQRIVEKEW